MIKKTIIIVLSAFLVVLVVIPKDVKAVSVDDYVKVQDLEGNYTFDIYQGNVKRFDFDLIFDENQLAFYEYILPAFVDSFKTWGFYQPDNILEYGYRDFDVFLVKESALSFRFEFSVIYFKSDVLSKFFLKRNNFINQYDNVDRVYRNVIFTITRISNDYTIYLEDYIRVKQDIDYVTLVEFEQRYYNSSNTYSILTNYQANYELYKYYDENYLIGYDVGYDYGYSYGNMVGRGIGYQFGKDDYGKDYNGNILSADDYGDIKYLDGLRDGESGQIELIQFVPGVLGAIIMFFFQIFSIQILGISIIQILALIASITALFFILKMFLR